MKKIIVFLSALSLMLFSAIIPTENLQISAETTGETVENTTMSNAISVDFNTDITSALIDSSDEDWFEFNVEEAGTIDISFTHETFEQTNDVWSLYVYAEDGTTVINSMEVVGTTEVTLLPTMSLAVGKYYIKVDGGSWYYSTNDYVLNVGFTADKTWETELNSSKSTANTIVENTLYNGTIMKGKDVDWYSFTLDEAKLINVDFGHEAFENTGVYWYVDILETDGTTSIYKQSITGNKDFSQTVDISLPAGDYYLKITPYSEYTYSSMQYSFTLNSEVRENWEVENNDVKSKANVIDVNTIYNSNIKNSSDVDYFKFSTETDGYVSLDFLHEAIESTSTYWKVIFYEDDAVTEIHSMSIAGNKELTSTPNIGLPAGDYYVKIVPNSSSYIFTTDLAETVNTQLTVKFTESTVWETENNNSKSKANSLELATDKSGSISTSSDADWYKFEVTKDGTYNVNFNHKTIDDSYSYWNMTVYEDDGVTKVDSCYVKGDVEDTSLEVELTAGVYYIKAEDSTSHSAIDYSVRVSEVSTTDTPDNPVNDIMIGDVNGDGSITADDALLILQYIAGLITSFR